MGASKNLNELTLLTEETAKASSLDFGEIPVFSAKSTSIILHNNTPISTMCQMKLLHYGPEDEDVSSMIGGGGGGLSERGNSSLSSRPRSLQTANEDFPELRTVSEDNDLLLHHRKGLILDATVEGKSASSALITPYSTIKIDLCCYNNMNGNFQDTFVCSVRRKMMKE